jgi:hypothetical protein
LGAKRQFLQIWLYESQDLECIWKIESQKIIVNVAETISLQEIVGLTAAEFNCISVEWYSAHHHLGSRVPRVALKICEVATFFQCSADCFGRGISQIQWSVMKNLIDLS